MLRTSESEKEQAQGASADRARQRQELQAAIGRVQEQAQDSADRAGELEAKLRALRRERAMLDERLTRLREESHGTARPAAVAATRDAGSSPMVPRRVAAATRDAGSSPIKTARHSEKEEEMRTLASKLAAVESEAAVMKDMLDESMTEGALAKREVARLEAELKQQQQQQLEERGAKERAEEEGSARAREENARLQTQLAALSDAHRAPQTKQQQHDERRRAEDAAQQELTVAKEALAAVSTRLKEAEAANASLEASIREQQQRELADAAAEARRVD